MKGGAGLVVSYLRPTGAECYYSALPRLVFAEYSESVVSEDRCQVVRRQRTSLPCLHDEAGEGGDSAAVRCCYAGGAEHSEMRSAVALRAY